MAGELPPGFTLDAQASTSGLPPGFTLDEPTPKRQKTWRDDIADAVDLMRPGGIGKRLGAMIEHAGSSTGEAVNDATAKVLPAELAAALGAGSNAAVQTLPMLFGGQAGAVAQPAFSAAGRGLMQSALRPSTADLLNGKGKRAIETVLKEGYSPTEGAVLDMSKRVGTNESKADALVNASSGQLDRVQLADDALRPLLAKEAIPSLPKSGTNAVMDAWTEFLSHPSYLGRSTMSVQEANAMKKANYQKLGDAAYGRGAKPSEEKAAIKALTEKLREGIESHVPAVAPINAETSALMNAKKIVAHRVAQSGNANPVPFGVSVAGSMNHPTAALGMWANSSDRVKALIARLFYSGQIPANVGRGAGLAYALQNNEESQ